jgi:[ribosomal protein S5]-alanine N-acetyltransferase
MLPANSPLDRDGRDRMIGAVGVLRPKPPELGYMLHREFWGRGLAAEALGLFPPTYRRLQPDVDSVEARVGPENVASVRIVERFGFAKEQMPEEAFELPGGGKRDMVLYRLRRPEEVQRREARDRRFPLEASRSDE